MYQRNKHPWIEVNVREGVIQHLVHIKQNGAVAQCCFYCFDCYRKHLFKRKRCSMPYNCKAFLHCLCKQVVMSITRSIHKICHELSLQLDVVASAKWRFVTHRSNLNSVPPSRNSLIQECSLHSGSPLLKPSEGLIHLPHCKNHEMSSVLCVSVHWVTVWIRAWIQKMISSLIAALFRQCEIETFCFSPSIKHRNKWSSLFCKDPWIPRAFCIIPGVSITSTPCSNVPALKIWAELEQLRLTDLFSVCESAKVAT